MRQPIPHEKSGCTGSDETGAFVHWLGVLTREQPNVVSKVVGSTKFKVTGRQQNGFEIVAQTNDKVKADRAYPDWATI